MFGLESQPTQPRVTSNAQPSFLAEPHIKLSTARSAFTLLNRFLSPGTAWLPSYLCGVVLGGFSSGSTRVRFYAVDERLRVAEDRWLDEVRTGDMVVFIDYFGFSFWGEFGASARKRGAWVVEDACQAMLNECFCEHSHYVIFSPRKFVGVPDGGILLAQGEASLPKQELPPPPPEWWLDALAASQLRAEYDQHGGDRQWFVLFHMTDPCGPVEPTRMSELGCLLLTHAIVYGPIARTRRENFRALAAALPEFAVFPELPELVVPLGFPVRLSHRDHVRNALFAADIFPPVHWSLAGVVPDTFIDSHQLAREIMTLPCDQRYGLSDMERLVSCFHKALRS